MALASGTHGLDQDSAQLEVRTYREGLAQKVGHDLIIDVTRWSATVDVGADGVPAGVALDADCGSLEVREGLRGAKPLTERDRREIRKTIVADILREQPIAFRSRSIDLADGRLTVAGDLAIAGATRPASFDVDLDADGHITASLPVTQTAWGIKPYRAFMGALKV